MEVQENIEVTGSLACDRLASRLALISVLYVCLFCLFVCLLLSKLKLLTLYLVRCVHYQDKTENIDGIFSLNSDKHMDQVSRTIRG